MHGAERTLVDCWKLYIDNSSPRDNDPCCRCDSSGIGENMIAFFEKWYVLFMLLRIARHNKLRMKFEKKYEDVFDGYGQSLEYMTLEKCYERDNRLYKKSKELKEYKVAQKHQRDDFGLYEYVDQHCGYCEDDFYGTIYTKTPLKNRWLERGYNC